MSLREREKEKDRQRYERDERRIGDWKILEKI